MFWSFTQKAVSSSAIIKEKKELLGKNRIEPSSVLYCMVCVSNLCFSFLEEFLEKEEAEGVEELLVNWHMVQVLYQLFR